MPQVVVLPGLELFDAPPQAAPGPGAAAAGPPAGTSVLDPITLF